MEVKYNNKWYDVLDTREFFGSTFYAIEDECRVKWLKDTDVEKNKNKVMAADKMEEILKHFPDLEEGWKEMEEKLKTEPVEGEMLSLKYREMLQRESSKESLVESEFTKAKRAESDFKGNRNNRRIVMAHLVDKDRIVAKIEKWQDEIKKGIFSIPLTGSDRAYAALEYEILGKVKSFIDTLEVKEVDLEKEILNYIGDEASCKHGKWTWYECNKMIRYFFELGLKAQKGE